eukprot:g63820.t1
MEGIGGVWVVMTMSRRISTEKERDGDDVDGDDDSGAMSDSCCGFDSSTPLSDGSHAMSARKLRRAHREAKERVAGRLHGGREGRGRYQPTYALSFYHRNIRGWLEGLRAHPARRALLLDAKERDYKKAEARRVPDYVSIRDRPLESIGDAIDSPRYEDYLKNLPLEDVKNWLSLCWSWDASPMQKDAGEEGRCARKRS